jgi:hypothetical protein
MNIRQVRFFIPHGNIMGGGSVNSIADAGYWFDAVGACIQSGMPVSHLDCSDVAGISEDMGSAFDDWVQAVAEECASRAYPADRFIIGAINEYGWSTNQEWQPHRFRLNGIIRAALPNHTIVEGPCYWKNIEALYNPSFTSGDFPYNGGVGAYVPWSDANTLQDVHHYYGSPLDGMVGLANSVLNWSAANGRLVYSGEWASAIWTDTRPQTTSASGSAASAGRCSSSPSPSFGLRHGRSPTATTGG